MKEKKPRRDYGDGSIYHRESDNRWVGSFYHDGERKYVYGSVGGKKEEVKQKLKEAQKQAEQGTLVASNKQRVSEYLEYWLGVKKLEIKDNTYQNYSNSIRVQLIPVLGKLQLQRLTTSHIQGCINQLISKPRKPSTIHLAYTILKAALEDAIEWKLIGTNPCKGVVVPRMEREELQVLNTEQVQVLLAAARGTDMEGLITLALATGLRRGELLGLKWSDVDFEKGVIRVQRTLVFINGEGYKEVSPKTKTSRRSITLTGFAIMALRAHRTRQIQARWQAPAWENKDLLFPDTTGGYMCFSTLQRHFKLLLEQAELPIIHFHSLRHSCATFLLKMKVPPKVVQEILGHSSIVITMDVYGHVIPGMQDDAMQQYNALLSPPEEPRREAN
jgi:integrase